MEEVVLKVKVEGSGDSEAKIKTVKQQLKEAKEAALQAKEGTEEYFAALQKAAGLADQLQDVNKAVNQLDPSAKAAAFGSLINGIAGGFQTITGLYGLLGEKSQDVEKLLLKVQAASAIAMGVQSLVEAQKQWKNIQQAIKATTIVQNINTVATNIAAAAQSAYSAVVATSTGWLKAFRIALAATGIGLVVVALAELIVNWKKVNELIDKGTEYVKKYKVAFILLAPAILALFGGLILIAGAIKGINSLMKSGSEQTGDYEEHIKLVTEALDKLTEAELKKRGAAAGGEKDIERQIKLLQAQGKTAVETASLEEKLLKIRLKNIDDLIAANKYYHLDTTDLEQQRKDLINDNATRIASIAKAASDQKVKDAKEAADKLIKSEHDITKDFDDELLKRQEADKKEYDDSIARKRLKRDEISGIEDETTQKIKDELQKRRDAEKAADDERADAEQQAFQEKQQRIQNAFAIAQASANALNSLNDLITQNEMQRLKKGEVLSKDIQKKQFNRQKALSMVNTSINTAEAIVKALATPGGVAGGVLAGIYGAMGAIQLAAIASKKFNPDGGGDNSAPPAPLPTGGGITPPSLQPVNTSGFIQQDEQNFKVYVVESDITNTQQGVQQNKKKALLTI